MKQVRERNERREAEKRSLAEQADMWKQDSDEFFRLEEEKKRRQKEHNLAQAEALKQQIQEKASKKRKVRMDPTELALNKQLLKEIRKGKGEALAVRASHRKLVTRNHRCPARLKCELCGIIVLPSEYDDHMLCHQLEPPSTDTESDLQLAQALQDTESVRQYPSSARLPPNVEQMLNVVPPELHHVLMRFRGAQRAPRVVVIHQRRPDVEVPADIEMLQVLSPQELLRHSGHTGSRYNRGAAPASVSNLPASSYRRGAQTEQCVVCITDFRSGDQVRTLPCFHKFHKDCIDEWLARDDKCPICKRPIQA